MKWHTLSCFSSHRNPLGAGAVEKDGIYHLREAASSITQASSTGPWLSISSLLERQATIVRQTKHGVKMGKIQESKEAELISIQD